METPVAWKGAPARRPPVASTIWSDVQSGSAMDVLQAERRPGLGDIVEGMDDLAHDLILLVALAGDHQHIAGLEHRGGGADRRATISDLAEHGGPGANLRPDGRRRLGARIVVGHDRHV